jgi:enoyl-CoA hydratase/carnithine racemase
LNSGKTNGINPAMVLRFSELLDEIAEDARGLVLCGGKRFFSTGLDLPTVLELDRPALADFWYGFNRLLIDLYTLPLPTACAIAGHAVAGGNILALACDYRYATTDERKKMGMNEIKLGIPFPYPADLMLKQIVGERVGSRMIYGGDFISVSEARAIGLVDETHEDEILERRALDKVVELASLQRPAFSATKSSHCEAIRSQYERDHRAKHEFFLDCWFRAPTQELLKEAAKKL